MSRVQLKPLFEKKVDPLTSALREVFKDNNFAMSWLGALSLGIGVSNANNLNAQDNVEEVIVTASKKEQNVQDIAMSVQAITSAELEKKNIKNLEDIANLSPAVTFNNVGPGKSNFYIRGVSDGAIMNSYASPEATTALYLDEQPLTAGSLTPDLHVYDIERVEVLMGPQGTLYGSSSTSGNIKIITKKPDPTAFDFGVDVEYGSITDGANDESLEAFVNIPIGSSLAARISAYDVQDGGWIDNKPASYTYQNYGINYTIDNTTAPYNVAKDDYNDSSKTGSRIRLATAFDNFNIDLSFLTQESQYNGSYETDIFTDDQSAAMPKRSNTRFSPEKYDDEFDQMSVTISGSINDNLDVILTSSIFERDTAYTYDYASYVEYYAYAAYPTYVCDYYDYYYYGNISNCRDPRMTYAQTNDIERTSTEFRIQSNNESGFNWILGAFKETNEKVTDVDYLQPGSIYPIFWEADLVRKGDIDAVFGEVYFDLSDKTELTLGLRKYDQTMNLVASDGSYGSYAYGINNLNFNSSETGSIPKLSLSHDISDDIMIYGSYSEGFRPSGVNRPRPSQAGTNPATYDPDYLDSYEIGVKSSLKDGKLILNGALYKMDWTDYQTSTYDTDITSVAYTENVGNAKINGLELNMMYSFNDTAGMTFLRK
jgi:outer membrane receptor protein involved in Fe transport